MTEHGAEGGTSLIDQFPELGGPELGLRETVENGSWHNNETVHEHSLSVFRNLSNDLELGFIQDERTRDRLNRQLSSIVGRISRRDTLLVAALLHDVGKPDTIVRDENGQDACPNHEAKGAEKARFILQSHDFDDADISRICEIVANHAFPHGITNPNFRVEDRQKILDVAKNDHGDILLELMLLGLADTEGSQLLDNNPAEFAARVDEYYAIIGSL